MSAHGIASIAIPQRHCHILAAEEGRLGKQGVNLFRKRQPEKTEPSKDSMISALEQRILDLEKLLKHSQLKCKALDTLIDIAEEQGIQIRKKSGAKQ